MVIRNKVYKGMLATMFTGRVKKFVWENSRDKDKVMVPQPKSYSNSASHNDIVDFEIVS